MYNSEHHEMYKYVDEHTKYHPDKPQMILFSVVGSHMYGVDIGTSDYDYSGIAIPPLNTILGINSWDGERRKGPDVAVYSLKKFCHIALKANPNILDLLFSYSSNDIYYSWESDLLRSNRNVFLSKLAYYSYTKYAADQLGLIERSRTKHGSHADLIEKYGFDTKNAMHLVRLFRMGYEILTEGEVITHRPDAEELIAIRKGAWPIERIKEYKDEMEIKCKDAFEKSKLPEVPDYSKVDQIMINIMHCYLRNVL